MQSSLRKSALFFIWGLVMSVGAAGLPGPEPVQGQCTSNDPTAPCFSDNDDILAGQRNLLRNDDLVVNSATAILNNSGMSINNYNLETVGGAVSSETVDNPVAAGCFIGWPLQAPSHVRVGRLFPLGNDVVVTLAPSSSAAGSDCNTSPQNLAFYVRDPQDSGNDSVTAFTDSASWTQMVLEDFDKDGNQDVFFINDRVAAIWAASDPGSPSAGLAQRSTLVLPTTEHTPVGTPVAGDFNADGAVDVAWPGG